MKARFWVAALLAGAGTVGSASAADLPMIAKAPPLQFWTYNWSGFYVGANVGGSWARQDVTFRGPAGMMTNTTRPAGGVGGGQIGYNWQGGSSWVFGLEADIQGTNEQAKSAFATPNTLSCGASCVVVPGDAIDYTDKLKWFGTLRGRIGYAIGDGGTWLPYITAGLAYGETAISGGGALAGGTGIAFSGSSARVGWTAGGGIEWAFTRELSTKFEYLYLDLGSGPAIALSPTTTITGGHMTDHVARVGLNYHF